MLLKTISAHLKSRAARERTIRKSSTELFWINRYLDGNLAIMAAPRLTERLDDKVLSWKRDGIDLVVSLLESPELPGLTDAEALLCDELGIEFLTFPIRDKSVPPSLKPYCDLVAKIAAQIAAGRAVAIHCRAGIGRSATLAACTLIWLGVDAEDALDMIAEARGVEVPETEEQRQWILGFPEASRALRV
jgi:hypothetical protein